MAISVIWSCSPPPAALVVLTVDHTANALRAVSHLRNSYPKLPVIARARDLEAAEEYLELTDVHWLDLHFMQEYWHLNKMAPDVRHVTKFLTDTVGIDKKGAKRLLFELFPYGCRYAAPTCLEHRLGPVVPARDRCDGRLITRTIPACASWLRLVQPFQSGIL
jgi:sulfur relay (sulfurtransferase) DsrC/TusE family protein